jgi:hypothetical protein
LFGSMKQPTMTNPSPSQPATMPYTLGYVQQLLQIDEQLLMSFSHALGLQPQQDDITGSLVFSQTDVDLLRRAIHAEQSGIANPASKPMVPHPAALTDPFTSPDSGADGMASASPLTRQVNTPAAASGVVVSATDSNQLSAVVDAVNQVKAGILKDLSQLLDDKLSGLDEVVIELIRAKSDNDALKQRMAVMKEEAEQLKFELSRFKLVQFGFYRKQ